MANLYRPCVPRPPNNLTLIPPKALPCTILLNQSGLIAKSCLLMYT